MSYSELTTKKARINYIRSAIAGDDRWLMRALRVIYSHQTADEQASETTQHHNDVGFNGADAEILSSFAKQMERRNWEGTLSDKQMSIARRKMPKYARQLERLTAARA